MVNKIPKNKNPSEEKTQKQTLSIMKEEDIALDFGTKVYKKFDKIIKSIILFGSTAKKIAQPTSDIDIIIIIDDVAVSWDDELIAWYREELGKIIANNPYKKELHVNTVKLSTWWSDLIKGDPIIISILRYGLPIIDFGGFFTPLKILLRDGKIKSTPEAIYTLLQRAPTHMARTKTSLFAAIDGLYWAMVDSAHAAIIAADLTPASPEEIPEILKINFAEKKLLKIKYVEYYSELHELAKSIIHGKTVEVNGKIIDEWTEKIDDFIKTMAELISNLLDAKKELKQIN
ncbi:MAG: nucleotidyltransferase domain-containing protein [Nanoarchaeota archaeon]